MRKKLTVVKMRRFTVQQRVWTCIKRVFQGMVHRVQKCRNENGNEFPNE